MEVAQGSSGEELSMPRDQETEEPDAMKVASPVLKRRRGERSPRRPKPPYGWERAGNQLCQRGSLGRR